KAFGRGSEDSPQPGRRRRGRRRQGRPEGRQQPHRIRSLSDEGRKARRRMVGTEATYSPPAHRNHGPEEGGHGDRERSQEKGDPAGKNQDRGGRTAGQGRAPVPFPGGDSAAGEGDS